MDDEERFGDRERPMTTNRSWITIRKELHRAPRASGVRSRSRFGDNTVRDLSTRVEPRYDILPKILQHKSNQLHGQRALGSKQSTDDLDSAARVAQAILDFQSGTLREESFRFLYRHYFPAVRWFFMRRGCGTEGSLDLAQEAFFGIYKGLNGFRHESRFETWLFRIADTTYLKRMRTAATGKRDGQSVHLEDAAPGEPALVNRAEQFDRVHQREQLLVLRQAIKTLPDQMRRCLTLRLYQDLRYKEISVIMGIKIDTVKAHLFQARAKLREQLGPLFPTGLDDS